MPDDPEEAGPRQPSTLSMVAGAVVVLVALVVGGALLVSSDVGSLAGGEDDDDLDVAIVGDSFADQSRAQFLELAAADDITAEVYAYGGTSICGWEEQLGELAEREPDQLVLSFAGNDLQPCMNDTGQPRDPVTVAADYRRDLEEVIERFRPTAAQMYVVMPPPVRDPQFEANAEAMRDMYRTAATDHPRITVIDPTPLLGPDGAFHATLPCRPGDECGPDGTVTLRQEDGIHLTAAGGRRYAEAMMDELRLEM